MPFAGADICIAFSRPGPGVISTDWVHAMACDAAVFAAANPVPEIFAKAAIEAGARIVATGRSDFSNQLNNSLVFPDYSRFARTNRQRPHGDCRRKELIAAARAKGPCR